MRFTRHWFARYGFAVVIVLAAVALRLAFVPLMGDSIPYLTIYPVMTLVAVTLGVGPGVLVTVVGLLLAEYYFVSPGNPIEWNVSFAIRSAILLLTSFYVGWVSARLRHALTRADAEVVTSRAAEEALRASEERLRALYASMTEGLANHEIVYEDGKAVDYIITDVNPAYERITGLAKNDAIGKKASELYGMGKPPYLEIYAQVTSDGAPEHFETYFPPMEKHLAISVFSPGKGEFATVFSDITARKRAENSVQARMRLMEFAATHSLEEILQETLDEVGKITDSPIGFYHFVEADQQTLSLQAWSTRTLREFCTAQGKGLHYNVSDAGVWVDCILQRRPVIHNDYVSLPYRKGLPQGHAQVIRELVVPILRGDRIVSILGVGNKPSDYTEKDVELVSYFADVAWEIAERRRAEERLAFQANLLANITDVVYAADEQLRLTSWNHAAEKTYGWKEQEVLGKNIVEVVNPELDPESRAKLTQELLARGAVTAEIEHQTRSGEKVSFESITILLHDTRGKAAGFVSVNRDITDRKRAQEALLEAMLQRQASQYARSLIEVSLDPFVTISPEGKITDVNEATVKATGMPRNELVGTNFSSYFTEPERAELGYRQVFAQGFVTDYPLTIRHRDGHLMDVFYNASLYKDTHGRVLGAFAAARDVTALKQAESELKRHKEDLEVLVKERTSELEESNRELARSNESLQQFAYVASHDLQEPLRVMSSYSQLLERRYKGRLDQDADEFIDFIVDAAARMQKLITDLLAYSRAGHETADMVEVDCDKIVRKLVASMAVTIESVDGGVTLDRLPSIMAHESGLVQLFQNLIGNALKFRGEQPPRIHVSAWRADSEWVFSVRDNGMGIEPQYNQRIFMIFQRLHPRNKYPGTGIGLSICKKIVENLGGRIWVESEPGQGSTFYFTVPVRKTGSANTQTG